MTYTAAEINDAHAALTECALWASTAYGPDESHEPISADELHDWGDVPEDIRQEIWDDLNAFMASEEEDLRASGLDLVQIGHDFWLTREGHGAGFWDRGLDDIGQRLSEAARVYGPCYLQLYYQLDENGEPTKCQW